MKIDIHDYFNSLDTDQLIVILKHFIDDDERLLSFLAYLLKQDRCIENGVLIEEKRGAMAGVPLASFFANIYLYDLDEYFLKKQTPYFRYSDDILIFSADPEQLKESEDYIRDCLRKKNLILNEEKYHLSYPYQRFEFLGFSYLDGIIDLSSNTISKIKKKIRHKTRHLYKWRKTNKAGYDRAAKAMIRSFDNIFYDLSGNNEFSWIRFYFPLINTADGLKQIDGYLQEYLRYLYSGRHYKGNYKISYEHLKKLGYTPLVYEYYQWKKENAKLHKQDHDNKEKLISD